MVIAVVNYVEVCLNNKKGPYFCSISKATTNLPNKVQVFVFAFKYALTSKTENM